MFLLSWLLLVRQIRHALFVQTEKIIISPRLRRAQSTPVPPLSHILYTVQCTYFQLTPRTQAVRHCHLLAVCVYQRWSKRKLIDIGVGVWLCTMYISKRWPVLYVSSSPFRSDSIFPQVNAVISFEWDQADWLQRLIDNTNAKVQNSIPTSSDTCSGIRGKADEAVLNEVVKK